ncbi:hypothetical protein KC19_1G262400 [Ceratodon purpureus]|uniref:Uncharacterized protein n=1 Tax=Ceratodon purpureus TaxID=3225 RepID=A0A8T0JC28_CERPU|nr:hypothetical protein KC19_1G262400 [Ceratodon purpureus]
MSMFAGVTAIWQICFTLTDDLCLIQVHHRYAETLVFNPEIQVMLRGRNGSYARLY